MPNSFHRYDVKGFSVSDVELANDNNRRRAKVVIETGELLGMGEQFWESWTMEVFDEAEARVCKLRLRDSRR
jgi:hypothetical protein